MQDSADPMESVELLVESVQKAFQPIHAVSARVCLLAYCISAVFLDVITENDSNLKWIFFRAGNRSVLDSNSWLWVA